MNRKHIFLLVLAGMPLSSLQCGDVSKGPLYVVLTLDARGLAKLEQDRPDNWPYSDVAYRRGEGGKYLAYTTIRKINDKIGHGLFATKDLKAGEIIGEYTGLKVVSSEFGRYCVDLGAQYFSDTGRWSNPGSVVGDNASLKLVMDAADYGNETRAINHSQQKRNVRFIRFDDKPHQVFVGTIAPVSCGQQFFLNYGDRYWIACQALHGYGPEEL